MFLAIIGLILLLVAVVRNRIRGRAGDNPVRVGQVARVPPRPH